MTGDWRHKLDCPNCTGVQAVPVDVVPDCERINAEAVCPECHNRWDVEVELWQYFAIEPDLPSRAADR
jgi:hypothetical protein